MQNNQKRLEKKLRIEENLSKDVEEAKLRERESNQGGRKSITIVINN